MQRGSASGIVRSWYILRNKAISLKAISLKPGRRPRAVRYPREPHAQQQLQTTDHKVVGSQAFLVHVTVSGIPDRTVGVDFPLLWRRNLQAAATRRGRGRKLRKALFNQAGSPRRTRLQHWAFRRAPSAITSGLGG